MSVSIRCMPGIGHQVIEVFESAGYYTIGDLTVLNRTSDGLGSDKRLNAAINARKAKSDHAFPAAYWTKLFTRCIDVIYKATGGADACDFVPSEYMCPLSLEWFYDPVVVASGHSYSRLAIEEHFGTSENPSMDPITRENIFAVPLYANIALRVATDHYRKNYSRFRAAC